VGKEKDISVVNDMGKNITECVSRGSNGAPFSVFTKRIEGV